MNMEYTYTVLIPVTVNIYSNKDLTPEELRREIGKALRAGTGHPHWGRESLTSKEINTEAKR
jgi:hypothetical protein